MRDEWRIRLRWESLQCQKEAAMFRRLRRALRRPSENGHAPKKAGEWITREEAAERAGCSPHSLYNWVNNGTLTKKKEGGRVYFLLQEIKAIARANRLKGLTRAEPT